MLGDKIEVSSLVNGAQGLSNTIVSLLSNGNELCSNTGANVMGNPLNALTWLSNKINENGNQLNEGDLVISGAAAASKTVQIPGVLEVIFMGLDKIGEKSHLKLNIES